MTHDNSRKKWRCTECLEISAESDLLRAKNPFDKDDLIVGCPKCKSVCEFDEICDEHGCEQQATCGFPDAGGYRRTCREHAIMSD